MRANITFVAVWSSVILASGVAHAAKPADRKKDLTIERDKLLAGYARKSECK